ncbi:hypothetical protein PILCRDRAFT_823860 [Piloderma croceum F 1598]|uniref:HAD hydrolase n=1 Tax=Piloderma croceum (strain F 1598) TaxID=765440 RepID=A0A0C3FG88_PILCF|nr:hypothetical protein PILCRDRAFT_823860 [Piloderma croceum F 1598]
MNNPSLLRSVIHKRSGIRGILCSQLQIPGPAVRRCLHNSPLVRSLKIPPLAFAFDIDGVLLRGDKVIPQARRALAILEGDNSYRTKIPYILVTNGGGMSEEMRCHKLSKMLDFEIKTSQLIQAHTILKSVVQKYANSPVLVVGGKYDVLRKVAEGYGFKHAYTTLDVHAWNSSVWPFHTLSPEERASTKEVDFSRTPISAIFIFHDPRNWSLDTQIICDILQSGGIIGGPHLAPSDRKPIELVFCNPDLIWKSDFDRPRLGQGAFKASFLAVYKELTGSTYPYLQYGKPTAETYRFAERVLTDRIQELYGVRRLPSVYMIGDNPESDIAGANVARWNSVLVHTGVYEPTRGPPTHEPTHEASDVEQAVKWAMDREIPT